jgi:membrane-bound metal-dependent hydrolase YbcI (DUF457 family)
MANFKKHAATGALVGLALTSIGNIIQQYNRRSEDPSFKFNWSEFLLKAGLGASVGALFGVLPDLLEPATCPNHRKFFHSAAASVIVACGTYQAIEQKDLVQDQKELLLVASSGYLSHLFLDSLTPCGLPLV